MKSTIIHLLSLFLIVAFTASCGKNASTGGSSQVTNQLNIGGLSGTSLSNAKALETWYKSKTQIGSFPIAGNVAPSVNLRTWKMEKSRRTFSEDCKKLLGFIQFCHTTPSSTVIETTTVTGVTTPVNKASIPALAAVMKNTLGKIVNIQRKSSYYGAAAVYIVDIQKSDLKYISVTIDTGVHPAFNPVSTYNYETKVEEYVSDIKLPF